jgi:hypothetical protein
MGTEGVKGDARKAAMSGSPGPGEVPLAGPGDENRPGGSLNGSFRYGRDRDGVSVWADLGLKDVWMTVSGTRVRLDGRLGIEPGRMVMRRMEAHVGEALFGIDGVLVHAGADRVFNGEVDVTGYAIGAGQGGMDVSSLADGLTARALVRMHRCSFHGVGVDEALAHAELSGGRLVLDTIEMKVCSGTVRGRITLGLGKGSPYQASLTLNGADLDRLLKSSLGRSSASGVLDLTAVLKGDERGMEGTVDVDARSGEIRKYELFSKVFQLLNVYKIVTGESVELLGRRFTYNRMKARLMIKGGMIRFEDFSLDSSSIQVSAVGTYDPSTRKIDAVMGVQPLESLDKAIGLIPVVGWVFTGDSGRFIVVSMKVVGAMDDPA